MKISIRPMMAEDIERFYGEKSPRSARGFAVEKDGDLVALAGVTIGDETIEAFSSVKEGLNVPKRTVYRYALVLRDLIASLRLPAIAIANPELKNSGRFLERMGFTFAGEFNNQRIYRLNRDAIPPGTSVLP